MIINLGQDLSLLGFWPLLRGSEPLCDSGTQVNFSFLGVCKWCKAFPNTIFLDPTTARLIILLTLSL